jgi:hypothetical protein
LCGVRVCPDISKEPLDMSTASENRSSNSDNNSSNNTTNSGGITGTVPAAGLESALTSQAEDNSPDTIALTSPDTIACSTAKIDALPPPPNSSDGAVAIAVAGVASGAEDGVASKADGEIGGVGGVGSVIGSLVPQDAMPSSDFEAVDPQLLEQEAQNRCVVVSRGIVLQLVVCLDRAFI